MNLKKIPLIVWLFLGGLILIAVTVICFQWYYSYEQRHDSVRFYADGLNLAVSDQAETIAIADLKAQQHMAQAAMVMTVASIFSAFVSALSAGLLVWTFREQRKMTENQSRAHLEVIGGLFRVHSEWDGDVKITFMNTGDTPAFNIKLILEAYFYERSDDRGNYREPTNFFNCEYSTKELGPSALHTARIILSDFPREKLKSATNYKGEFISTEFCREPYVSIKGRIEFVDAFNRSRQVALELETLGFYDFGSVRLLGGTDRMWEQEMLKVKKRD